MALKTFGGGWDPNDSLAPDNSGAPPFQNDVDLPYWQGGGKGFGGGGPIAPPQGTTLTTTPPAPNRGASGPGFGVGGGSRPYVDPTTGEMQMLDDPNLASKSNIFGFNPSSLFGGPAKRAALTGAAITAATPAETGELSPRFFTGQGVQPGLSAPQGTPYEAPRGMPGRAIDAPQTYPHMPWPDTGATPGVGSAAPAVPPPRPGPAVTAQRPDLGTYAAPPAVVPNSPFTTLDYRPNSGPNERNRGSPVATALDLSRFFGGGQPAPAAAAPVAARGGGAPTAANPNNPYWGPNSAGRTVAGGPLMPNDITGYPVAGVNVPATASGFTVKPDLQTRKPRSKSSSTSQGGGQ